VLLIKLSRFCHLPCNGWNGSSAALRHKVGTWIRCSLSWSVALL